MPTPIRVATPVCYFFTSIRKIYTSNVLKYNKGII